MEIVAGSRANAILTFRDKDGNRWSAAAFVGPLLRLLPDQPIELDTQMTREVILFEDVKGRGFALVDFKGIED